MAGQGWEERANLWLKWWLHLTPEHIFVPRRMLSSSICAPGARDMKVLTFQIILSDRVWLGAWRMSTAKSHTSTTDFLLDSGFYWFNLKTLKACRKHSSFSQISNNMQQENRVCCRSRVWEVEKFSWDDVAGCVDRVPGNMLACQDPHCGHGAAQHPVTFIMGYKDIRLYSPLSTLPSCCRWEVSTHKQLDKLQ